MSVSWEEPILEIFEHFLTFITRFIIMQLFIIM